MRFWSLRWQHRERGAAALVTALVITFVAIPTAAFTVDLGIQRVARKDAQAVADTAALDVVRQLLANPNLNNSQASDAARDSASRDSGVAGATPTMTAYVGYIAPGATFIADHSLGCGATTYNSYFQAASAAPSGTGPNAVLVVASASVNRIFSQAFGAAPGSVCRSAIATTSLYACMTVDSYAAAVRGNDSTVLGPLQRLLGTGIDLSAISSSGILNANVTALDFLNALQTQIGVGSTSQVLAANVTALQVVQATTSALQKEGLLSAGVQGLINKIAITGSSSIAVSTLLGLTQGGSSALSTTINALDLLAAAAQVSNGSNSVALNVSSANLTGLSGTVTVGVKPTLACLGSGTVSAGQVSVQASANINAPGSLTSAVTSLVNGLSGLVGGLLFTVCGLTGTDCYDPPTVTLGTVTANVALAQASGSVNSLSCSGSTWNSMAVTESSALAPMSITIPITISETRHYRPNILSSWSTETQTTTWSITVSTTTNNASTSATLSPSDYDVGKPGPSNNLSLNNATVTTSLTSSDPKFGDGKYLVANLLTGLNAVVSQVSGNLVTPLQSLVTTPLFNTLTSTLQSAVGATIAGSTYTPLRTPSCGVPGLG